MILWHLNLLFSDLLLSAQCKIYSQNKKKEYIFNEKNEAPHVLETRDLQPRMCVCFNIHIFDIACSTRTPLLTRHYALGL